MWAVGRLLTGMTSRRDAVTINIVPKQIARIRLVLIQWLRLLEWESTPRVGVKAYGLVHHHGFWRPSAPCGTVCLI